MKNNNVTQLDISHSDQYNNLFKAISRKGGYVLKEDIINLLETSGINKKDNRIQDLIKKLNNFSEVEKINLESFKETVSANISIIEKAVKKHFAIPDFTIFKNEVEKIYDQIKDNKEGTNAKYIPQLARVNPEYLGVSFCSVDGQVLNIGDYDELFCLESSTKAINYCIALELQGTEKVHQHVGREPSGAKFNEITLNSKNLPHNPMINAGAIMICSLIKPELSLAERFEYITNIWKDLTGGERVGFDNTVYHSEKLTADRNYALSHFMKEMGAFPKNTDIEKTLDFYFQCCSIQVNTWQVSRALATIANGGISPYTGQQVFSPETVKNCLSMMYSCGMYDFSGEYAFTVGLPAKSGVSGVLMIIIPQLGGFTVFSPRLDEIGNSVRGIDFSQRLVEKFNFHNYDSLITSCSKKIDPRKNQLESDSDKTLSLIWAASQGDISEIKRLIALGADIDAGDYDGRTAMHLAAAEGQFKVVEFLIEKGVNVNPLDRWGNAPLIDATKNKHSKIIELLKSKKNNN